ncbi:MAG: hypothetical protein QW046_05975 [Candidatus Micrarchaeaceae archaeon]
MAPSSFRKKWEGGTINKFVSQIQLEIATWALNNLDKAKVFEYGIMLEDDLRVFIAYLVKPGVYYLTNLKQLDDGRIALRVYIPFDPKVAFMDDVKDYLNYVIEDSKKDLGN